MRSEDVVHVHAGIQRREGQERAAEHSSRDQQHDRESDLRDDKCALQRARSPRDASRAGAERPFDAVHLNAQRRGQAEQHAARERNGQREQPDG